jgi:hypothetical protein
MSIHNLGLYGELAKRDYDFPSVDDAHRNRGQHGSSGSRFDRVGDRSLFIFTFGGEKRIRP